MDKLDVRICFVGDSFVNGTGDPEKMGWAGRLCAMSTAKIHDITYYNLGVRRNTSADVKKRWQQECQARLPEASENMVVFSVGVNDTVIEHGQQRVKQSQSIENARQFLSMAQQQYAVAMIGPPPIDDLAQNARIKELDAAFQVLCHDLSIPYLSVFSRLLAAPIWLKEVSSNDGAHPRSAGYAFFARLVKAWSDWPY